MSQNLQAALFYAAQGWPVCPLHSPTGRGGSLICTCKNGASCGPDTGKHPRWLAGSLEHGLNNASTDEALIRHWWKLWPAANIAIRTGAAPAGAGFFAVDIDPRNGGDEALAELLDRYGPLPPTIEAVTGGGGRHILLRQPGGYLKGKSAALGAGLDVKADGGYITAAPSLHKSGRQYEWEASRQPGKFQLAEPPEWLLALLRRPAKAVGAQRTLSHEKGWIARDLAALSVGHRNDTLFRVACRLRHDGWAIEDIVALLLPIALGSGLDADELAKIAASAGRYETTTRPSGLRSRAVGKAVAR